MTVNTKWNLTGVHGLNKFLWTKLQSELGWDKANYGGLTPITVPAQQPEFNNYNFPYVVYNYSHQSAGTNWWEQEEQVSYAVYSANEADIRQFINVVREYMSRYDDSASMLNDYIRANGSADNKNFDYKYIYTISTSGAQPPVTEGGRMDGLIILRLCYTYYDPTTGKDRLAL